MYQVWEEHCSTNTGLPQLWVHDSESVVCTSLQSLVPCASPGQWKTCCTGISSVLPKSLSHPAVTSSSIPLSFGLQKAHTMPQKYTKNVNITRSIGLNHCFCNGVRHFRQLYLYSVFVSRPPGNPQVRGKRCDRQKWSVDGNLENESFIMTL